MPESTRSCAAAATPAASDRDAGRQPLLRHIVGGVLRAERLRQGRTLREVAAAARVSMPYLSEVERGRKEASSEVLAAVAAALGLRLVDLVGLVERELVVLTTLTAPVPAAPTPAPFRGSGQALALVA